MALENGRLIPSHLQWLVVNEGKIVSAHRAAVTARIEADALSGHADVLTQNNVVELRIGQDVRNDNGRAVPA